MKRLVACVVLVAAAPAVAQQTYTGNVLSSVEITGGGVYHRIYHPAVDDVSPGGEGNCVDNRNYVGFDAATRSCESRFTVPPNQTPSGYRGYLEDIFNDGQPAGDVRYIVWDAETNSGTGAHAGYYFFAGRSVNIGETSTWNGANCAGIYPITCLGQGNDSTSAGTTISNTPIGTINPIHGFRPIPVPLANGADWNSGDISLQWATASDVNGIGQVSYDLYGLAKTSDCAPPAAAEFTHFIRTLTVTGTVVNVFSEFGTQPWQPVCYYFALKLRYPNAGATPVVSRYFSANGQATVFGGLFATVTSIEARAAGHGGIAVSWKTSLEDGVKGFYVARSFTANGAFERVSGLVPAKGEPATYTYLDTGLPALPATGNGVYYRIEAVDVDDARASFGPVKADLGPALQPVRARPQRRR